MGSADKIAELERELSTTKYNKATQGHVALVKAKIARLKDDVVRKASGGKKGEGFEIRKSGDASVVLLGFPSVGKSTLLTKLTDAKSEIAAYAFTTLTCIPGVLRYKHAKIQILDVPGIVHGAASGRGRGKEVLAAIRNADMVIILLDALHPEHYDAILAEAHEAGLRINKRKPDIVIKKKDRGGLALASTVKLTRISPVTIQGICRELGISNADIVIRTDINDDDLIDVIEANKVYLPGVTVVNKADLLNAQEQKALVQQLNPDLMISANKSENIEALKKLIFDRLQFIRIYLKEAGKKPDLEEPLIMREGCTIKHVCDRLHRDFVRKFKFARVWGPSAKFDGQQVRNVERGLKDEDILEIHLR